MQTALSAEDLEGLLQRWDVTGASVAVVVGDTVSVVSAGQKNRDTGDPVTRDTLFDAASLTKPLVSHAVLQLVDAGVMDLDAPVGPWLAGDDRAAQITPRQLLTHTAGLQNLRGEGPLRLFYPPGHWFSYSSVGFMLLQRAIEARTQEPLDTTVRRLVFEPLGMERSSLEWREAMATAEAAPHEYGVPVASHRALGANASYSLKTTAADFGAFLATAVLGGARLKPQTWADWLTPAVMLPQGALIHLDGPPVALDPSLGWGLGWGLETQQGCCFQWGKMPGMRAFVMGHRAMGTGVVALTNSHTGLRLMQPLVDRVLPGEHPAIRLLLDQVTE